MGRLNKPAIEGYKYRSPNQTNAKDLTPNLREDVIASQKADTERISRGMDTAETRPQNRKQVQEAGGRAVLRSTGRLGLGQTAYELGYMGGRALDEKTGIGKKIVDKSGIGDAVDKVVNMRDKVELSPKAKARLEEKSDKPDDSAADKHQPRYSEDYYTENYSPRNDLKKGGAVKSKVRGHGIESRGKTKGRFV